MKSGNWMPIDKNIRCFFPHGRPYTEAEAILSLALDKDNKKKGTISGYAKLWSWGRKKTRKFLEDLAKGGAHPRHRRGTGEAQGVTLKINNIQECGNTKGTGKEQARNTTIEPKPKPKKKHPCASFDLFWQNYPKRKRKNRGTAERAWEKIKPDDVLMAQILSSLALAVKTEDWLKEGGKYIPLPSTWLSAKGWLDEYEVVEPPPKFVF